MSDQYLKKSGNTSITSRLNQQAQMNFTVDELLAKIDAVKKEGFGPEPTLLEAFLNSGARDLKKSIDEAKASAIRARKELIDGLAGAITIYIDTHRADLKVRGATFVTTTFATLTGNLNEIMETTITNFYEVYSQQHDSYERIKNLTETVREKLRADALERAHKAATLSQSALFDILEALKQQVIKLSEEIGVR